MIRRLTAVTMATLVMVTISTIIFAQSKKPNILVIWGDDVGYDNLSAYNDGMMGYKTPNIDRLASEGAMFTDTYAEQSCTAGRSAFILGQHPFRTGLLTIGMPGSDHGIQDTSPTMGDILKSKGYRTGQFGKNHLGDQDKHLPTNHGFDEFFGSLYHLNAEDEPETYHYPKDPDFRKKFGPRGVIRSSADGPIKDTGPLTKKRMETIDEEFLTAAMEFMEGSAQSKEPFFLWFNSSRMHNWTRLKESSQRTTGIGLYADGLVEHDGHVGQILDKLKELGIIYFGMDGTLNAVRWNDFKAHFNFQVGPANPFKGAHMVSPIAPMIFNLRADLFERAQYESGAWETFAIDQMWLFVPLQQSIKEFLVTIPQYPFQMGSSLTVSGINYDLFRRADAMKKLEQIKEELDNFGSPAGN